MLHSGGREIPAPYSDMELLQYWKVIQKNLWLILLILVVGMAAMYIYTTNQPAEYESSALLLLNASRSNAMLPPGQDGVPETLADSYTQILRSQSFGEDVVKQLPFSVPADRVRRVISTKLVPNTLFFQINARMSTPERSQQMVSTVVNVFLSTNAAQEQIDQSRNSDVIKNDMRQRLENELKQTEDKITSYENEIKALQATPPSTDRDNKVLELRGQLISLQKNKTDTMADIANIGSTSVSSAALVIDDPLPGKRIEGRLLANMGLAFAVSLLLGVGLAFLRDYIDYTVHTPEQLEEVIGLSSMGAIGMVGGAGAAAGSRWRSLGRQASSTGQAAARYSIVALEDPKSPEAESFRVLRTNIQFSSLDKPIRNLVITSAAPGEGKSFVAANLAVVMAQAGKRVILVDADLRRPTQHKVFGLPNRIGFTDLVLSRSAEIAAATQSVLAQDNLAVITSGPIPPNPSELLNSRQAAYVIEQLAHQADFVIYDAAPAGAVTDSVILSTHMDAVILVIAAGSTRRDMITRLKQTFQNVGVGILLPVLNRVKVGDMQGYYYYRYYGNDTQQVTPEEVGQGLAPSTNGKISQGTGRRARKAAEEASSSRSTIERIQR